MKIERLTDSKELFEGDNWSLPTDIDLVGQAEEALKTKIEKAGWDEASAEDVQIAFHEALVNAFAHGNLNIAKEAEIIKLAKIKQLKEPTNKKVHVSFEITKEKISIIVRDEGNGFDPKKVADPTVSEGLFETQGRGMLMMRAYVDSLIYNERGNEVTMVKVKKVV